MLNEVASPTITPTEQVASKGWMQSLTDYLNFDTFLKKFNLSTAMVIETLSYAGAGFILGFFVKRYLRQTIVALVILILALKGLEYMGVSTFALHWSRVKELTGIAPEDTIGSIIGSLMAWIQHHVRQVLAAVIGFLIGYKVG